MIKPTGFYAAIFFFGGMIMHGQPPFKQLLIIAFIFTAIFGEVLIYWFCAKVYYPWKVEWMHRNIRRLLKERWDDMSQAERNYYERALTVVPKLFNNTGASAEQTQRLIRELQRQSARAKLRRKAAKK